MRRGSVKGRTLLLALFVAGLAGLLGYVMVNSGPLARFPVTVQEVGIGSVSPALFGIGVVEARAIHRVGASSTGRLERLHVQTGDLVAAGQLLGEISPVDLDDRIEAQRSAVKRLESLASAAGARVEETAARKKYAEAQSTRYDNLLKSNAVSVEAADAKRQERQVTAAAWTSARSDAEAARSELARAKAELDGMLARREDLRVFSPVDGLVAARDAEPGDVVAAGQAFLQVADLAELRVSARFDQSGAAGLQAGLPAEIVLRSRPGEVFAGRVLRVEPMADSVTEETSAKIVFDRLPDSAPPLGELAEVTVRLPASPEGPVIPDAALRIYEGRLGVWTMDDGSVSFKQVSAGRRDLDGRIRVLEGLEPGERVVVYSARALKPGSRVKVTEGLTR